MNNTENTENNISNIMNDLKGYKKLNLDDTFNFHCTECGKCCKHREDIILTSRDIYNISKELSISINELISQYCEVYIGPDSHIPIVRILPRGNVKRCPFLKSNKCLVHNAKPTICSMFPIGRTLLLSEQSASPSNSSSPTAEYIFNNPGCGDNTETYTVRDWLKMFNIPINDEFFILWSYTLHKISCTFIKLADKNVSMNSIKRFVSMIFNLLYLNYTLKSTDFINQFKENKTLIEEICSYLNQ